MQRALEGCGVVRDVFSSSDKRSEDGALLLP